MTVVDASELCPSRAYILGVKPKAIYHQLRRVFELEYRICQANQSSRSTHPGIIPHPPCTVFCLALSHSNFLDLGFDGGLGGHILEVIPQLRHKVRSDLGIAMDHVEKLGKMRRGEGNFWASLWRVWRLIMGFCFAIDAG